VREPARVPEVVPPPAAAAPIAPLAEPIAPVQPEPVRVAPPAPKPDVIGVDQAPAAAVDAALAAAAPPLPPTEAENPNLILLIEDDERIAKFYSILFQAKGFAVENARDGLQGVDMATQLRPALILLDVMMPKMNGLMVLQTLKAQAETASTPVVVLSNYMEPPLIQRALQLGAIEYVVKSQARPNELVEALPKWLQGEPALH